MAGQATLLWMASAVDADSVRGSRRREALGSRSRRTLPLHAEIISMRRSSAAETRNDRRDVDLRRIHEWQAGKEVPVEQQR